MRLERRPLFVENFIWRAGESFDVSNVSGLDEAAACLPSLSGQFALHFQSNGRHLLARDPLGVNKLFFALTETGRLESSNYLIDLRKRGYRIDQIWSVPSGHALIIDVGARTAALSRYCDPAMNDRVHVREEDLGTCASDIRRALESTFCGIRQVCAGRPVFVTMSGGLDSTTIAVLAREYLANVEGVTFCVAPKSQSSPEDEDVYFARRAAAELGIPLTVVPATPSELLDLLDDVLLWGQDWRDFNVHCGLVNAAIARAVAKMASAQHSGRPLLLTGDTMNEMMADYAPVKHRDREYYRLPQLSPGRLRRFLVTGLDTGDREVGIFARMGISTIQPYALCARACLSIPQGFLEMPAAKRRLFESLMGDRIPEYICSRPKVRAQTASAARTGGTLGVLVDAGVDDDFLEKRWCELFGLQRGDLRGLIRAGLYKFTTTFPSGGATGT